MSERGWEKLFGFVLLLVSAVLLYLLSFTEVLEGWTGTILIAAILTPFMLVARWWLARKAR